MDLQWIPVVSKIIFWFVYLSTLISPHCFHSQSSQISESNKSTIFSFPSRPLQRLFPLHVTLFPILSLGSLFLINSHVSSSPKFSLILQVVSVTSSGLRHPKVPPSLDDFAWASPIIALSTLRCHCLVTSPSSPLDCDLPRIRAWG